MDERRLLPRWEIKRQAKVWIPLIQGFNFCTVEDMHFKGMCLSFERRLPHDKEIRLSFSIGEDYDFIKVEAQIPWMKEDQGRFMYGLLFTKIAEDDKQKISNYINSHCFDQLRSKWWG